MGKTFHISVTKQKLGTSAMKYTENNKRLVLNCLRKLCDRENLNALYIQAKNHKDSPKSFVNLTTFFRMLDDDYDLATMRLRTFDHTVWFLNFFEALEGYQEKKEIDPLYQKSINLSRALKQFINPNLSSIKHLADKLVGQYQGYRWSISFGKEKLDLFRLVIEYDEENDVLISKETTYNHINGKQDVLVGAVVINLNFQNRNYIISRSEVESIGLKITTFHCFRNESGEVYGMNGTVYGYLAHSHFVRSVYIDRHDSPEIKLVNLEPLTDQDKEKYGEFKNILFHLDRSQRNEKEAFIKELI